MSVLGAFANGWDLSNFQFFSTGGQGGGTPRQIYDPTPFRENQDMTADPVSTASGTLWNGPYFDLSLGGPLPLFFRRTYQSTLSASTGVMPLGANWMSNFDPYLTVSGNLAVLAVEGGGSTTFQLNAGKYQTLYTPRMPYQLVQAAGGYQFMDPESDLIYSFNSQGQLTQIQDRNGNSLAITRGGPGGKPSQVSDGLGRTLIFTYNNGGNLIKVMDQTGRSVSYSQDGDGNLITYIDALGNATTFTYTSGELMKATLPRGNAPYAQTFDPISGTTLTQTDSENGVTSFAYAVGGTPGDNSMTDPLGRTTAYAYSNLLDLSSYTDAAGNTASYTYDGLHRLLTYTDRRGSGETLTYDPVSGNVASIADALGHTWTYTYQAQVQGSFTFYNLTQIGYPDGTKETYTYDGSGNLLTLTDQANKLTTYTYNARGQVTAMTNAGGGGTAFTYNADGTLASFTLPGGATETYSYDALKRLSGVTYADNTSFTYTRDALDRIVTATDERGNVTQFAYDANGNPISTTDALRGTSTSTYDTDDLTSASADELGEATSFQRDALGSLVTTTDPTNRKTTFTYDNLERLQSVADPVGNGTSYTRDAEGNTIATTDALGNTWSVQVNANNLPVVQSTPLNEATTVSYDAMNRATGFTDALGRTSTVSYENRGLPATLTGPGSIATTFAWGSLPVLQSATDPNGNTWSLTHDSEGRLTRTADPLGRPVAYSYDSRDRLATATSPIDSVQYGYDPAGNLIQAQYSDNVTLTYSYDADNQLTGGTGFALAYDAAHRLTMSNGLTVGYDAAGRILSITYANGKTVTYSYDNRGLLQSVTDWNGGSVTFSFDAAHRLVSMTRSNGMTTQYAYDADGQLLSITEMKGSAVLSSIQRTLDAIGRVTASTRNVPQEAALTAAGSQSTTYDAAEQIVGDTYDARGRLAIDGAGATYRWSAASRLLAYNRPDGAASFTYDGLGQRIARTVGGSTVDYVVDYATGLPTVAVVRSGGADVTYYVYTPGGALLYSIDTASGARRFYSFDDMGSTIFLTDDTGAITDTYGNSPYGDVLTAGPNNKTNNPFIYQGQVGWMQEAGTSLIYARFRYYDSTTGRFLSPDPMFSGTPREINPYQYAQGDPMAYGDPMGAKSDKFDLLLLAGYVTIFTNPVLLYSFDVAHSLGGYEFAGHWAREMAAGIGFWVWARQDARKSRRNPRRNWQVWPGY